MPNPAILRYNGSQQFWARLYGMTTVCRIVLLDTDVVTGKGMVLYDLVSVSLQKCP